MYESMVEILFDDDVKELYQSGAPSYATFASGAVDLCSADDFVIYPGDVLPVRTGIKLNMTPSPNICGLVLPRSGLGTKKGLVLANTVGLIDNDYQGPVTCYMMNRCAEDGTNRKIAIKRGEKFAQLLFVPYVRVKFIPTTQFRNSTARGEGGFGSTG